MIAAAELRSLARDVATAVGSEVAVRRRGEFTWQTKSSLTDVVTEIDTWAEIEIVRRITDMRPTDGFRGEEGTDLDGSSGVTWIIDPVDGTTNLVYDVPGYSVSVAAAIDGRVVAGAVFDPVRSEVFDAALGDGSTRNGEPIEASSATDLSTALVGTGFSYSAEIRRRQAEQLAILIPEVRDIRRMGGAALDLCSVACGRLDAYFEHGLSPWDSAAGALIAVEAGAVVSEGVLTTAVASGMALDFHSLLERMGA